MRRALLPAVVAALLAAAPAAAAPLDQLQANCRSATSADAAKRVAYRICTGRVPSFDGTLLDVTLTLPANPRRRRLPLIVFLHGFLTDKGEYLSQTRAGTGPDRGANAYKTVRWNNIWFASRGYAVLNYSARGHGGSDGQIALANKHIEVRDTQHLTGLLVDQLPINRKKVGVIGSSYGGGQAWLLLTTRGAGARRYGSWRSPGGRIVRLGAVVPGYTWTDLLGALLPGGGAAGEPLGVGKLTIVDGLVATANTKLPPEVLRWVVRLNAGEPYELGDPVVAEARRALVEDRSALYQERFFRALRRSRRKPIPVLAGQGWTDPIFPAEEAVRMYTKLRAAKRRYPIQLYFGDFEHLTSFVKVADLSYFHRLGNRLLDRALRGRGKRIRSFVRSAASNCDASRFGPIAGARTFRRLARRRVEFELAGPKQALSPAVDPRTIAADPLLASTRNGRGCIKTRSGLGAGVAGWTVPVPSAFTLRGLPRLTLRFRTLTADVQLNSRLWDVAPDGERTLVTRGAKRVLSPDPNGADVSYELFGNHWRFEAGHQLELEIVPDDSPYLRRDNFPALVTVERAHLSLPAKR